MIRTSPGVGTIVLWDEAPAGATAARFGYGEREQVVPVERGCALAVFDNVTADEADLGWLGPPAWIHADGREERVHAPGVSEMWRGFLRHGLA